uniref:Lipoprotein n=1 Tax=Nitratidesulfovibrio vulgaris (strain DSM 19637 / Miyazaki F) TaxID=883 RepID=B8DP92_NITV9
MKQGRIALAAKALTLPVTLALALTGAVCVSPAGAADTATPQAQQTKKTQEKAPAKSTDKTANAAPQKPATKPTQVAKVTPAKKPVGETIEDVHNKLDTLARAKLRHMNESLRPCQTRKDVVQNGNEFVARYLAVDPDSLSTDVHDAQGPGAKYVGLIVYHEQEYESRAATKEAALTGDFSVVKARRVTEIIRYDKGKWID